jgi:hypothetical protein
MSRSNGACARQRDLHRRHADDHLRTQQVANGDFPGHRSVSEVGPDLRVNGQKSRGSRFGGSPSQGAGSFRSPPRGDRLRPSADGQAPHVRCVRPCASSRRATPARLGTRPCHPARSRGVVPRLRHDRRPAARALRRPRSRGHQTGAGDPCLTATANGAAARPRPRRTWSSLPPDRRSRLLARNPGHLARPLGESEGARGSVCAPDRTVGVAFLGPSSQRHRPGTERDRAPPDPRLRLPQRPPPPAVY